MMSQFDTNTFNFFTEDACGVQVENTSGEDFFDQESLYDDDEIAEEDDIEDDGLSLEDYKEEVSQPDTQSHLKHLTGLDSDSDSENDGQMDAKGIDMDIDVQALENQLVAVCRPCDEASPDENDGQLYVKDIDIKEIENQLVPFCQPCDDASAGENDGQLDAEDIQDSEQLAFCHPYDDHKAEWERKALPQVSLGTLKRWFPEFEPNKTLRFNKLFCSEKKSKPIKPRAPSLSCYEKPRSPELMEIEDDALGSVVPDFEGLHSIDRQGPCRLWYDKMDLPHHAKAFSYHWLTDPKQDDLDKVDKAVEGLLDSLSRDSTKKRRRDDDSDVGWLPYPKRLKIVSQRNDIGDVMFDTKGEKHGVVVDLIGQLSKDDYSDTPEGRFLLTELVQNGCLVEIRPPSNLEAGKSTETPPDAGISTEKPPNNPHYDQYLNIKYRGDWSKFGIVLDHKDLVESGRRRSDEATPNKSHYCDHYKYFNVKLYRGDWINDIIWDHKDLLESRHPRPVTVDETLFSYLKEDEETAKESKKVHNSSHIEYDSHYRPDLGLRFAAELGFCHSTPVDEMSQVIFPPIFSNERKLRIFHRPKLSIRGECELEKVFPLGPHMEFASKQRKIEESNGEYQHMKKIRDLTGKDGDLILLEFSEDYPPFMNQLGMASEMCNYYLEDNEVKPPQPKFGENVAASRGERLFFGYLRSNQCLNAIENKMYRAPIFEHVMKKSDFLVIYSNESFYIRTVDALFAVGQQCPLMEVPKPYCKLAHNILRDYVDLYICRLFWRSRDHPKSLKMEDLRRAFPSQSEVYLRRRLSQWSEFNRVGNENKWVVKRGLNLPEERDLNLDLTPELYCAYESMRSAELRLKDEGYHIKENEEGEDDEADVEENEIEDALKAAPWSTTNAYMMAMDKKCLLDAYTSTDPTDCGVGYSYIKVPCKPIARRDSSAENANKSKLYNTDADFRRLTEGESNKILRNFGVPSSEINKLSRFEKIGKIRDISTEKAKLGVANLKFARQGTSVLSEHKKKYMDSCQRAFELQNTFLACQGDHSYESMLKTIGRKSLVPGNSKKMKMHKDSPKPIKKITRLTITRTFADHAGRPVRREEVVTNPELIRRYLKEKEKEKERGKKFDLLKKGIDRPQTKTKNSKAKKQQLQGHLRPLTQICDKNNSHLSQEERERLKREKKRERDRNRYQRLKHEKIAARSNHA